MNAVVYLRVSTLGQLDGFGLDVQEQACIAYAKAHGLRVIATFRDEGVSGTLEATDRDGLMSALARLRDGDADALLVARLDRLARSLTIQEAVLAQVWKHHRAVHSVDVGEVMRDDPDDPMRTAMRQMAGVFAQLDRGMVVKRMRDGRKAKAAHGGHCYVALRKVMKHALWDRRIAFNPCDGIDLPKSQAVDDGELSVLTVAQAESAAAELASFKPYDVLVRFMAYTGLRAGEVAWLRVRDVDLAAGHVSVRQTAQWIKRHDQEAGEWVFGTPKSRRSSRDVPILDRKLLADLKALKMQHPRSGDGDALFWPGRTPGWHRVDYGRVWDVVTFRRNYFKPALTRAELPAIRVHDLRHTAASLWLAAGFPPYQVSRWLGHASVVTTDTIYSHLYPTDYAQHIARFERFAAEV